MIYGLAICFYSISSRMGNLLECFSWPLRRMLIGKRLVFIGFWMIVGHIIDLKERASKLEVKVEHLQKEMNK